MTNQQLNKTKDHAFGKDVYLLGRDSDGTKYWLESPSWDCGWYWGFGYVESYRQNWTPSKARDIDSHQHIDSSFVGDGNAKDGGYCHNIFDSKMLDKCTFTESEGWELSELFKQFYTLSKSAEMFGRGGCHITSSEATKDVLTKKEWVTEINEVMIPKVTSRILEILTPDQS